ncbi:MAG TPA: hypothetical protein HA360_05815 [Nanoarchaeota archaeon]|nr:hypothetical protein [Candidatus Woesearchaeota archaeon]HIH14670.1 hypothetical protein [Nanoarchaeota archaeon]HIH58709.1 hypothetical protein [Nanoarchaeota archaeon]HII14561.1 hypothetical protein [Nanoarchaeota archaeon]HIJ04881.1 hypothetical protein [Nanoarchaeota archaeon]
MNIPLDFRGFLVPSNFTFESYSKESPIEIACRLLIPYSLRDVEIGCEVFPEGLREVCARVPEVFLIEDLFRGIDRTLCDYVWLDLTDQGFYVIQRIVLGDTVISQVEKRITA